MRRRVRSGKLPPTSQGTGYERILSLSNIECTEHVRVCNFSYVRARKTRKNFVVLITQQKTRGFCDYSNSLALVSRLVVTTTKLYKFGCGNGDNTITTARTFVTTATAMAGDIGPRAYFRQETIKFSPWRTHSCGKYNVSAR